MVTHAEIKRQTEDEIDRVVDAARMFHRSASGGTGSIISHRRVMKTMQTEYPQMFEALKRLLTAVEQLDTAEFFARHPDKKKIIGGNNVGAG